MGKEYTFSTPLDAQVLDSFYYGDLEYALKMFEVCIEELPRELNLLKEAHAKGEVETCRQILHKVKPTFTMVGNDPLSQECGRVEKLISNGQVSFLLVKDDVSSIIEEIDQTLILIEEESENLRQHLQT